MKTTTTIKAFAYPVIIKDHRTGEKFEDVIVLPKEWLQICGSDGVNICDDKHMIYRVYNVKGYEVLEVGKRRSAQLTVDLEELYFDQTLPELESLDEMEKRLGIPANERVFAPRQEDGRKGENS